MQFSSTIIDRFIVLADATKAVATPPQPSANFDLYETLKDFQPLIAAFVALIAAGMTFYSARKSYRSAQDVAIKNIAAAKAQTDLAYHNKQTGMVRWLYLRTVECGVTIDRYTFNIQSFCNNFQLMAGLNMRHVKEETFRQFVATAINMNGVYEKTGLREETLLFWPRLTQKTSIIIF